MPFQMDLCWDSPRRKIGNRLDGDLGSWGEECNLTREGSELSCLQSWVSGSSGSGHCVAGFLDHEYLLSTEVERIYPVSMESALLTSQASFK